MSNIFLPPQSDDEIADGQELDHLLKSSNLSDSETPRPHIKPLTTLPTEIELDETEEDDFDLSDDDSSPPLPSDFFEIPKDASEAKNEAEKRVAILVRQAGTLLSKQKADEILAHTRKCLQEAVAKSDTDFNIHTFQATLRSAVEQVNAETMRTKVEEKVQKVLARARKRLDPEEVEELKASVQKKVLAVYERVGDLNREELKQRAKLLLGSVREEAGKYMDVSNIRHKMETQLSQMVDEAKKHLSPEQVGRERKRER